VNLRPYQQRAVDGVLAAHSEGKRSTLIVMPTGTGKTVTFAHVVAHFTANGKRAIVIAHRSELIHQAAEKILAVTGHTCDIEMADQLADSNRFWQSPCIVATVQTLNAAGRLGRFNPADFGLVITDEAHHATSKSYRTVIAHFSNAFHLGVTATPDRSDEEALGKVFESVAYSYEIEEAIADGYLVPIYTKAIEVQSLDFTNVRTTAGDLNGADLAAVMESEKNLHAVAGPLVREAEYRRTLVFASSVAHAERLAEIINRIAPQSARWICGATPKDERAALLAGFTAGEFQFLVNVGVFTEGFDEPTLEMVAIARPTKSRSLYAQMVGRGTRTLPGVSDGAGEGAERLDRIRASNKPSLLVLDFVGASGRHKLVSAADILGGNYTDDEVHEAESIARERTKAGSSSDVTENLKEARARVEARKVAEAAKRRSVLAQVTYSTREVKAFDTFSVEPYRERAYEAGKLPSEPMIALLAKFGVPDANKMTFAQAKGMIGTLLSRKQAGLATYKQCKILKARGIDGSSIKFEDARTSIDAIAAREGWSRKAVAS